MADNSRAGLLLALAGFATLSCGDAIIKTMAGAWSPIAVAALRFTIGAIGLSILLYRHEGSAGFRPRRPWMQFVRGLCLAGATLCFFSAIFVMPLAEATALVFVAPVFTALLSGPLLKERTAPVIWIASLAAFAGVLIILRPNLLELGWAALLPLIAAMFMGTLMIANRAVVGEGSALSMQVFVAAIATPILILAAVFGRASGVDALHFGWPDWTIVARCTLVAVIASTAHWLIYLGISRAGAAVIAPMSYVQLLVAAGLGWLWFGHRPDATAMMGAAIIIGAGLVLWYSNRPGRIETGD